MKRYHFLGNEDVYEAINKLRNAFLAAKDGNEVIDIINSLLTPDERIKIGRRVLIAELLTVGYKFEEITTMLSVGRNTIAHVARLLEDNPNGYKLISIRSKEVEKEVKSKRHKKVGGSQKVFKTKVYTGFKRSDVKRKMK